MKKILIIFILLIMPNKVFGSECEPYLKDLKVNGYGLTPNYHQYQYNYSIWLEEEIDTIDIVYEKSSEENGVIINNNHDLKHLSVIDIEVWCENKGSNTYKIMINKEITSEVWEETNIINDFNLKDQIITICILSIIYLFILYTTWYLGCKKVSVKRIKDSGK